MKRPHETAHVSISIKTKWPTGLKQVLVVLGAVLALAGLCSAGLAAQSLPSAPAKTCSQAAPVAGQDRACKDLSSLPVAAQRTISRALGGDDARYRMVPAAGGTHAENPQHALTVDFTPQGVAVHSGTARWGMALLGYGYGEALRPVPVSAPKANANLVEYRRGALTEWYVNGPFGVEQGFTLAERPGKANGSPLTLALALSGNMASTVDSGRKALALAGEGGAALHYAGLAAYDAVGRELRAWLELHGDRLLLRVDDAGAQYPVVVDPFVQQAKLTASDGAVGDQFGGSVAISGDGDTVVAGAPGVSSGQGAAYVFVKLGTAWAQNAKLTASDGVAGDHFGYSVAVSGNGDTVVAGAPYANISLKPFQGAVYVFAKPSGGWADTSTFDVKLTPSDDAFASGLGFSVAISGDTLVAGAPGDSSGQGAVYVFAKPSGGWATTSTFVAKLTASDGAAGDDLGDSVAISGDTLVAGALNATVDADALIHQGAAYVFVKPGTGWATPSSFGAKLTAYDGADGDDFGISVAISGDGDTVVAGAPFAKVVGSSASQGAAYVFVNSGTVWAQNATLTSNGEDGDQFGGSVAISGDGDTVVAGAPNATVDLNASIHQGAAYVFVKPVSIYPNTSTFDVKLTASDDAPEIRLGLSVAISGATLATDTVVAGAPNNALIHQGAAYVFSNLNNSAPTFTFDLSTLLAKTFGNPPFPVASYASTNSTGTISFVLGTGSVGCAVTLGGQVTITGAAVGGNFCVIAASLAADATYAAAGPLSQSFHIALATPTISISNLPSNAMFGGSFTPAYANTGDGATSVTSSTTTTCTVALDGSVKFIHVGTCTLTAHAAADANYNAATGALQSFKIAGATPTISINNLPSNATFGGSFTATYAYAGNGITFATSGTLSPCLAIGSRVFFVGTGTCTLTAHATATANYAAATGSPQQFTIAKATTKISIKNIPGNAENGRRFTPLYNYIGDGTPSVTSSTLGACTVSRTVVNFIHTGTCTLTAAATAGTNYAAVTGNPQSFTIKK
ncbi:MAG: FG-GAP repeat protein [Acidobacteriia bacterium]|nr:FG-GAP repeat protein [Terriglobia bacterium]